MRGVVGVVGAVLVCLAAAVLALGLGAPTVSGDGPLDRWRVVPDDAGGEEALEAEPAPVEVLRPPDPVLGVPEEVLLSMVVASVAAALLLRSLLRARRTDDPVGPEDPDVDEPLVALDLGGVEAAARRGLRRLDEVADGDPTEVVVACWVELEIAGGRAGSGRLAPDTPSDFARRLLVAVPGLDPTVLDELRRTYSRVRYGSRQATPADVATARAALEQLLAAVPSGSRP